MKSIYNCIHAHTQLNLIANVFAKFCPVTVPASGWFLLNLLRLSSTNQNTPVHVARSSLLVSLSPGLEGCKVYLQVSPTLLWD